MFKTEVPINTDTLINEVYEKVKTTDKSGKVRGFSVPTGLWKNWMEAKLYLKQEDVRQVVMNASFAKNCLLTVASGIELVSIGSSGFLGGKDFNITHYLTLRNGNGKPALIHKIQGLVGPAAREHYAEQIKIENVDYKYFHEFLSQATLL